MEEFERYLMSEANGEKLLERQRQIEKELIHYLDEHFFASQKEMRKQLNKMLYDIAEQNNMSLWDLCFKVVPRTRFISREPDPSTYSHKGGMTLLSEAYRCTDEYEIVLIPLEIDFEHGEGYWEHEYHKLVKKLKNVIDDL